MDNVLGDVIVTYRDGGMKGRFKGAYVSFWEGFVVITMPEEEEFTMIPREDIKELVFDGHARQKNHDSAGDDPADVVGVGV